MTVQVMPGVRRVVCAICNSEELFTITRGGRKYSEAARKVGWRRHRRRRGGQQWLCAGCEEKRGENA